MPKKNTKYLKALNVLLIIGMLLSLLLVYEHFSPTASEFCSFGASLDCGIVNKSPYANLDGFFYLLAVDFGMNMPNWLLSISETNIVFDFLTANAFLGFLTLLFVFVLNTKYKNRVFLNFINKEDSLKWIRGVLIFGMVYGFYLFLIQHFVLKTYCIFCLALDLVLISSVVIAFKIKK